MAIKFNPIPIFYYHSIAPDKDPLWNKSFLTFNLVFFEDLLKYLSSVKFEFLSLDEYFIRRSDPASKNKRMICFTFDDGYLDNYVYVYPLLKKYRAKGTIFMSPFYAQENNDLRPTLEDVWNGKVKQEELKSSGFLSWKEMKMLEESGVMDIQSHTMTHTKYFSSDKIREFHHPGSDYLYPVGNLFPDRLPYYINDPDFKTLIPFGTPFFEETSSLVCKRVFINKEFEYACLERLKGVDWNTYDFEICLERIKPVYDDYKKKGNFISHQETRDEYGRRVEYEITASKKVIEEKLNKTVNHICWPHGDYNDFCHETALNAGYRSSHIVLRNGEINSRTDRFDRTGSSVVKNNRFLSLWKAKYKLGEYRGVFPYNLIKCIYRQVKYGY